MMRRLNSGKTSSVGRITPPQPLSFEHDLSRFNCPEPSLNLWLQQRALKNEGQSSRGYLVVDTKD